MGALLPILLLTLPALAQAPQPTPPQPPERDIRVQLVATNAAVIGAPMAGRLVQFPLKDGDRFAAGDVLAKFACGEQQGALAHARAVLEGKRAVLSTQAKIKQLGTGAGLDYQVAVAAEQEAAADLSTASALAEHCQVTAPFAGRVAAINARNFQFVAAGAPLIEILDDHALELEMILPSSWVPWLKPGLPFQVAVQETGQSYKAEIVRISGKVDAVSQSIKVYGRVVGPAGDLLPGMSGRASIAAPGGPANGPDKG